MAVGEVLDDKISCSCMEKVLPNNIRFKEILSKEPAVPSERACLSSPAEQDWCMLMLS